MREIKFRAWDKIRKKMCVVIEIQFYGMYSKALLRESNGRGGYVDEWRKIDDMKLLEYTGLKDEHSKKQYHKDIKRCGGLGYFVIEYGFYDNGRAYEEYQGGYGWYLKSVKTGEVYDFTYINLHTFPVVGNIYENLDLLGETTSSTPVKPENE